MLPPNKVISIVPTEIWIAIFRYLDRRSLKCLRRVCRRFAVLLRSILLRRISLSWDYGKKRFRDATEVPEWDGDIHDIRIFASSWETYNWLSSRILKAVCQLPNLERVSLTSVELDSQWMQFLAGIPSLKDVVLRLSTDAYISENSKGISNVIRLRSLELQSWRFDFFHPAFFANALSFISPESLETFCLTSDSKTSASYSIARGAELQSLYDWLRSARSLRELQIPLFAGTKERLLSLLSNKPSMKRLCFSTECDVVNDLDLEACVLPSLEYLRGSHELVTALAGGRPIRTVDMTGCPLPHSEQTRLKLLTALCETSVPIEDLSASAPGLNSEFMGRICVTFPMLQSLRIFLPPPSLEGRIERKRFLLKELVNFIRSLSHLRLLRIHWDLSGASGYLIDIHPTRFPTLPAPGGWEADVAVSLGEYLPLLRRVILPSHEWIRLGSMEWKGYTLSKSLQCDHGSRIPVYDPRRGW